MLWPVSLSYLEVLQKLLHFTTSTITVLHLYFYISLYPIKKSIFRFAFCLFRPSSIGLITEYRVIIKFSEGIYFPVCKIGWGGRQGLTTTATGLNKMAIHQYASRNSNRIYGWCLNLKRNGILKALNYLKMNQSFLTQVLYSFPESQKTVPNRDTARNSQITEQY